MGTICTRFVTAVEGSSGNRTGFVPVVQTGSTQPLNVNLSNTKHLSNMNSENQKKDAEMQRVLKELDQLKTQMSNKNKQNNEPNNNNNNSRSEKKVVEVEIDSDILLLEKETVFFANQGLSLDENQEYQKAYEKYMQVIPMFFKLLKNDQVKRNPEKMNSLNAKVDALLKRAEEVKVLGKKQKEVLVVQPKTEEKKVPKIEEKKAFIPKKEEKKHTTRKVPKHDLKKEKEKPSHVKTPKKEVQNASVKKTDRFPTQEVPKTEKIVMRKAENHPIVKEFSLQKMKPMDLSQVKVSVEKDQKEEKAIDDLPPLTTEEEYLRFEKIKKLVNSDTGLITDDCVVDRGVRYSRNSFIPIYKSRNYLGEMGDEYLSKTEFDNNMAGEGYMIMGESSVGLWYTCWKNIVEKHFKWLNLFKKKSDPRIARMSKILKKTLEIHSQPKGSDQSLYNFLMSYWMPLLKAMADNEVVYMQGGWTANPGHAVSMTIVRKKKNGTYSFILTNSGGGLGNHAHSKKDYPISKAGVDARIDNISEKKFFRTAIWMLLFKIVHSGSTNNSSLSLYDVVLSFFCKNSFADELYKTRNDPSIKYLIPQHSGTCFYKSVTFGTRYVMREIGFSDDQARQVRFAIKRQYMEFALIDLKIQKRITMSEIRLINLGIEHMTVFAKHENEKQRLKVQDLKEIHQLVKNIKLEYTKKDLLTLNHSIIQPKLDLKSDVLNCNPFDNFEYFVDFESEEKKEQQNEVEEIKISGVFALQNKAKKVMDFNSMNTCCGEALKIAKVAFNLDNMSKYYHVMQIVEAFILSVPFPNVYSKECWTKTKTVTHAQQLALLKNLKELMALDLSSSNSLPRTNILVSRRALVVAVFLIFVDTVTRKVPSDKRSVLAELLRGYRTNSRSSGGLKFSQYSRNMEFRSALYYSCLQKVNEYFHFYESTKSKVMFKISEDHWMFQECTDFLFIKTLLEKHGIKKLVPGTNDATRAAETYEVQTLARYYYKAQELDKVCPQFKFIRDAVHHFSYALQSSPPRNEVFDGVTYSEWESRWFFWMGDTRDTTSPKTAKVYISYHTLKKYRHFVKYPVLKTLIDPSLYIVESLKEDKITENDVLYNRKLPSFNEILTQEDAEKLFSLLTVRYLSLPLVLNFFTSSDRISLLLNEELFTFLEDLFFKPGDWISAYNINYRKYEKIPNDYSKGTGKGLLFNELLTNPQNVIDPIITIMKFVFCELNTKTYKEVIGKTIFFAIRLISSLETFIIEILEQKKSAYLQKMHLEIRKIMENEATSILTNWLKIFQGDVSFSSKIHAHFALIFKSMKKFNEKNIVGLLRSLFYINIYYGFASEVDDAEVRVKRSMDSTDQRNKSLEMKSKVEKKQKDGRKKNLLGLDEISYFSFFYTATMNCMGYLKGLEGNKVSLIMKNLLKALNFKSLDQIKQIAMKKNFEEYISDDGNLVINIPLCKVFISDQVIKPVNDSILKMYDFSVVFGKSPRHAAVLSETTEKIHMEIVGNEQKTEIVFWRKPRCNQFLIRAEEVLTSEKATDSFSLVEECAGIYKFKQRDKIITCTMEIDDTGKGKWHAGGWWMTLDTDPSMKDHLLAVGKTYGGKNYRLKVIRDESKRVQKLQFFGNVYELRESHSPVPLQSGFKFNPTFAVEYSRAYSIDNIKDHEKWIVPLVEVVLVEHFGSTKKDMKSALIDVFLPSKTSLHASKVKLLVRQKVSASEKSTCTKEEQMCLAATWKEMIVYRSPLFKVDVYNLCEYGRKVYRRLIYTSNSRYCLGDLTIPRFDRSANFFENFENATGSLETKNVPENSLEIFREYEKKDNCDALHVESLVGSKEQYVPYDFLSSIPDVLALEFIFWKRKNHTIIGEPRKYVKTPNEFQFYLKIELTMMGKAYISKIPFNSSNSPTMELVNVERKTKLLEPLTRLENISHILVWSENMDRRNGNCSISLIEMPRLKLTFTIKKIHGEMKLCTGGGLMVSDLRKPKLETLMKPFPHSILLENNKKELFILCSSCPCFQGRISMQPLHDQIVELRSNEEWLKQNVRTFIYPVHRSLNFVRFSSRNSIMYYVLLSFLNKEYSKCCKLLDSISIDSISNDSERFYVNIFEVLKDQDFFPNGLAVKLKIVLALYYLNDESVRIPFSPGILGKYLAKAEFISKDCLLSIAELENLDPAMESFFLKPLKKNLFENGKEKIKVKSYSPSPTTSTHWGRMEEKALEFLKSENARKWEAQFLCDTKDLAPRRLTGKSVIALANKVWDDFPGGSLNGQGFLMLLQILTGRIRLSIDGKQDDSFLLGKKLSHAMYFRTSQQMSDVWKEDSFDPDRSLAPFSVLAALTKSRQSLFDPTKMSYTIPKNDLDDFVGYYTSEKYPNQSLVFLRDGTVYYLHNKSVRKCEMTKSKDQLRITQPRANWVYNVVYRNSKVHSIAFYGHVFEKQTVKYFDQKLSKFDVPMLSFDHPSFKGKFQEKGSKGVGVGSNDGKVKGLCKLYVDEVCTSAENILEQMKKNGGKRSDTSALMEVKEEEIVLPSSLPYYIFREEISNNDKTELKITTQDSSLKYLSTGFPLSEKLKLSDYIVYSPLRDNVNEKLGFSVISDHAKTFTGKKYLERIKKDKIIYSKQSKNEIEFYFKIDSGANGRLDELIKTLSEWYEEEEVKTDKEVRDLLDTVNNVKLGSRKDEYMFEIVRESYNYSIKFSDLLLLLMSSNDKDMKFKNPFLSAKQTQHIISDIVPVISLRINRLGVIGRAVQKCMLMKKLLSSSNVKNLTNLIAIESRKLASLLLTKRYFFKGSRFDPQTLFFEYVNDLLLRKNQVELLNSFLDGNKNSQLKQLLMGQGKTAIISPICALKKNCSGQIVFCVCPSPLIQLVTEVLTEKFSTILTKKIQLFQFDRQSTLANVKKTLKKLQNCRDGRDIMVCAPESIKCLWLKYVELLNKNKSDKQIPVLQEILRMLRNHGVMIMDEVDLLLHPLKSELNFPVGDKSKVDLSPERWEIVIHLVDALLFHKTARVNVSVFRNSAEAKNIIKELEVIVRKGIEDKSLQNIPHLILLEKEFYYNQIKPCLIKLMIVWLQSKHVFTHISRNAVFKFLKRTNNNFDFSPFEKKLPKLQLKYLNYLYDTINIYFPHCLTKICRVGFGLLTEKQISEMPAKMPISRSLLAIPFKGKDVPTDSSEFAHPNIQIILTALGYVYEGMRLRDTINTIVMLKRDLLKEIGPRDMRPSSLQFTKWVTAARKREKDPELKMVKINPLSLLQLTDKQQLKTVHQLLKNHPAFIFFYLENKVFPEQMFSHSSKLSACGQDLGNLFPKHIAFSGTTNQLVPLELGTCDFQLGTDGKILHYLTNPDYVSVRIMTEWSVQTILEEISSSSEFIALIDVGAIVTGFSNVEVAKYLINGNNSFKGIVYLDEEDKKKVILRGEDHPLSLSESNLKRSERFSFYDQVHTTGMHIDQPLKSKALLTIGKDTTLRDFSQGVWRMRSFGREGQSIEIIVIPEMHYLIKKTLGSSYLRDKPIHNIIHWLCINSMASENLQFVQLQQQNLHNVWKRSAYFELLQDMGTSSVEWTEKCFKSFKEKIDFAVKDKAPQSQKFSDYMDRLVKENMEIVKKDNFGLQKVQKIKEMSRAVAVKEDSFDSEQEKESEVEIEQEKESEQEQQQKVMYCRDEEDEVQWNVSKLKENVGESHPFYRFSEFSLFDKRLKFPDHLLISQNYFKKKYKVKGFRRLRNIYCILDWIPSLTKQVKFKDVMSLMSFSKEDLEKSSRTFSLFDLDENKALDKSEMEFILKECGTYSKEKIDDIFKGRKEVDNVVFEKLVQVGFFSPSSIFDFKGRFFVVLSLSEIEAIKFLIDTNHPFIQKNRCCFALKMMKEDNDASILAMTNNYYDVIGGMKGNDDDYLQMSYSLVKFLDCSMNYSDQQFSLILSKLQNNPVSKRLEFFENILKCKRRVKKTYKDTPITKLFQINSIIQYVVNRGIKFRMKYEILKKGIKLVEKFREIDENSDGYLSADELFTCLKELGIRREDIDQLVKEINSKSGLIDVNDFQKFLFSEKSEEQEAGDQKGRRGIVKADNGVSFQSTNLYAVKKHFEIESKKIEDPELHSFVSSFFGFVEPAMGYAFSCDEKVVTIHGVNGVNQTYNKVRSLFNQKKYRDIIFSCKIMLTKPGSKSSIYKYIFYYVLASFIYLKLSKSITRKLIYSCAIKKEWFEDYIVKQAWLINYGFSEWKLSKDELLEIWKKVEDKTLFEDAVLTAKIEKLNKELAQN